MDCYNKYGGRWHIHATDVDIEMTSGSGPPRHIKLDRIAIHGMEPTQAKRKRRRRTAQEKPSEQSSQKRQKTEDTELGGVVVRIR
jgi:hypothetical protein